MVYDAVVLPGGPDGSVYLAQSPEVIAFVRRHDELGKLICPICSAAARVLGGNGLLKGRRYVCSGDLWQNVTDGQYVDQSVVEDGNLISGKGLGRVFDFAFTVASRLLGDSFPAEDHADHIYYPGWTRRKSANVPDDVPQQRCVRLATVQIPGSTIPPPRSR